ncbi:MAG: galactose mutarotase-like enzyme [Saprospiraceae bacterium]|jgi:galactose mutarotase-like enzyme
MKKTVLLQNNQIIAQINYQGAELSRLYSKQFSREILWDGNPAHWGRHAPVLFPFVGKLKDGKYEHQGNSYSLGQHGFARDQEFTLIEQSDSHCTFELVASEKTKMLFPFDFSLKTTFTLSSSGLKTEYTVKNKDNNTLYFSLGAHPAFNCPMKKNKLEDYQLIFEKNETAQTLLLDATGLLSNEKSDFLNNKNVVELNDNLFEKDALMFTDLRSTFLTINSEKDELEVKVSWKNFPYLGIWKPIGAPFICIEPWSGIADFANASGKLSEKFGINSLEKDKVFMASYDIMIAT